jgi:hypothetical protein
MMANALSDASLKSRNFKWLCSLAIVDVVVILVFVFPDVIGSTSRTQLATVRGVLTSALPVIVLMLSALLPASVKASLVYWKGREALPGHEAFSRHAVEDPRIDIEALTKSVGVLPSSAVEQNAVWYRLYKQLDTEVTVVEAHRAYLLFRDMAAISVLLVVLAPLGLYLSGASLSAGLMTAALFAVQYAVTAIAARNSGIRFVTNVLAVQALRERSSAKAGS